MTVEIEIRGHKCLIDDIDADLLGKKWHPFKSKHDASYHLRRTVHTPKPRRVEHIHRIIMSRILGRDLDPRELVDHQNLNGLDNTRQNLRLATNSQNQANRRVQKNNKLGIKGVTKYYHRYHAHIMIDGKFKHLGTFATPEQAHAAYVEAAAKRYGEFARGE